VAKYGTKKTIPNPFDTQTNPRYGGPVKPTTPPVKKVAGAGYQDKYSLQRDQARAEAKHNRGAVRRWKNPHAKSATSKGGADIPSAKPSQRVGKGPGYDDSRGYVKR